MNDDYDLADCMEALRDDVLSPVDDLDQEPPGVEIFDAVIRAIVAEVETSPGLDMALHEAISRRLAWGELESIILADAEEVYDRLLIACQRVVIDPVDEILVAEVTTEVVCAAARVVAHAAISRGSHERAACLREELVHRRLRDILHRQEEEFARLGVKSVTPDGEAAADGDAR